MVSSETLQIIIDAKDLMSSKVNQAKNALRQTGQAAQQANQQAANSTNTVSSAYDRLRTKVTSTWNSIKSTIQNSSTFKTVSESALAQPFMNAAEKIKQKYSSMVDIVKGKLKSINGNQVITIKGNNGDVIKKINVTRSELLKIEHMNVDPFKHISTAGLQTLNGQIVGLDAKLKAVGTSANTSGGQVKTLSATFGTLRSNAEAALTRVQTKFQTLKGHMTTLGGKITNLVSGFSGLQGVISGALGALGVSSLKAFTIDAAMAREKINAVTKSLVGSGAEFTRLNSTIKSSIAGTTLGFNNVAKAVNTVGLRYHMTAQQLNGVPPVMTKVGLMAQAMGKSNEEAASMMEHAYDGLQGKWRTLAQTFGMSTKDMKQALLDAGWSGASDDVEGYNKALEKLLDKNPKLKEMMNTTEYKMESLKMSIKGIGTEIGLAVLPYLNMLVNFFQKLSKEHPGVLKLIVTIGVIVGALASIATVLLPIIMLFQSLSPVIGLVTKVLGILLSVAINVFGALMTGGSVIAALGGPITVAIAAIVALIAILGYLYFTNEDFRNGVNAVAGAIKGALVGAFNWLMQVLAPVIDSVKKLAGAFVDLLNGNISFGEFLWQLIETLAQISTAMPRLIGNIALVILQALGGLLLSVGEWIVSSGASVLEWIGTMFMGLITGVSTWLGSLWEGLVLWGQQLWVNISTWFTTILPLILQQVGVLFLNILTGVGTFFMNLITGLTSWQISIWTMVVNFLMGLYNSFITWASNIVNGFIQWISTLPGRFYTWLMNAYQRAVAWATQTINKFKSAAQQAVNGFIQWISTLPGKFWTWLMNTLAKIASFASQCLSKMRDAAKSAVDGFINKFKELPGKVWDELMRVGDKILSAGGTLAQKAYDLGKRIVDSLLSPFDFGSPGIVSRSVGQEMVYMREFLEDAVRPLTKRASIVGSSVVDSLQSSLAFDKLNLTDSFESDVITEVASNVNGDVTFHSSTEDKQLSTLLDVKNLLSELITLLLSGEVVTGNGNTAVIVNSLENADTSDILGVLREHIDDRDILRQIAASRDFQELDTRYKNSTQGRLNRHI